MRVGQDRDNEKRTTSLTKLISKPSKRGMQRNTASVAAYSCRCTTAAADVVAAAIAAASCVVVDVAAAVAICV